MDSCGRWYISRKVFSSMYLHNSPGLIALPQQTLYDSSCIGMPRIIESLLAGLALASLMAGSTPAARGPVTLVKRPQDRNGFPRISSEE